MCAFMHSKLWHFSICQASLTCLEVGTQLLNTRVLHLDTAEMICHVECGGSSRVWSRSRHVTSSRDLWLYFCLRDDSPTRMHFCNEQGACHVLLGPDQTQLCHNTQDTRVCHVYRVTCLEPDMSEDRDCWARVCMVKPAAVGETKWILSVEE